MLGQRFSDNSGGAGGAGGGVLAGTSVRYIEYKQDSCKCPLSSDRSDVLKYQQCVPGPTITTTEQILLKKRLVFSR